ncbi:transposase [Streptomyces sp. NBC_01727]|uniref:transposase n=1 Tax=Streptomyces sp. NBC_01727 TaxID=2975924 RepID=UPI003FA35F77
MAGDYAKRYSEEFKRDAVALACSPDKTITEVARDLGVSTESLRSWVKRDRIDRGEGGAAGQAGVRPDRAGLHRRPARHPAGRGHYVPRPPGKTGCISRAGWTWPPARWSGRPMAGHQRAALVVDALRMAHGRGGLEVGRIARSDCGSEYVCAQFRREIGRVGLRQSTGRTGTVKWTG